MMAATKKILVGLGAVVLVVSAMALVVAVTVVVSHYPSAGVDLR